MTPPRQETSVTVKTLLAFCGLMLATIGSLTALAGWFVDVKIQSSTNQILNVVKEQTLAMESRILTLEANVTDRWTATNEYQLMMEFQDSLKNAGVAIPKLNPYDIKRQAR